ncbi:hypothetical protein G6F43_008738 [Rhizopus delemar]|nr:hypothetical protein G6F43_008738 [Rhizopus delemar]
MNNLESLSLAILQYPTTKVITQDQKPLVLTIKKLKRFMVHENKTLITWIVEILRKRNKEIVDPINEALVQLLTDVISFHEAIDSSVLITFFELIRIDANDMAWLLNLVGERLPHHILPYIHQYLVLGLSNYGNPFLASKAPVLSQDQMNLFYMSDSLFQHLLNTQSRELVIHSLVNILKDHYLNHVTAHTSFTTESWSSVFHLLYENNTAGNIFYYEKTTSNSIIKNNQGEIETITNLFSHWLANVAFDPQGLIIRHAMDVMIMLDTLVYDNRFDLSHILPSKDGSILDSLQPSIRQLRLEPASIDLIDWIECRVNNDMRIPFSLLQLALINNDSREYTIHLFVQLITKLSCANHFVTKLIPTAESKWPGIFQQVLENIFSKTIAIHIADTTQIEKILCNLAMLYEDNTSTQKSGFDAFQNYISSHSRQVLLIFINHPSVTCRIMGYRVLNNSKFYKQIALQEQEPTSRLLMDVWFRHLKARYLKQENTQVIDIQQTLISNCCQNATLAKIILSVALEHILNGALEIFPVADINSIHQQTNLFDKINRQDDSTFQSKKPPRFVTCIDLLKVQLDTRDKVYIDNIERTASLFDQFKDTVSTDEYNEIHHHIISFLSSKWTPTSVSLTTYDDALPKNIPHACDIVIGNAFKDHPALFLIFEKCIQVVQPTMTNDMIRSILVYFIVFWNMKEVINVPTTLTYATQLEETIRMTLLLKPVLPESLETYSIKSFGITFDIPP